MKKSRTIRLNEDLDNRLTALCEHIGTNPNAYLVAEIGKAISRDEVALLNVQGNAEFRDQMSEIVKAFAQLSLSDAMPAH